MPTKVVRHSLTITRLGPRGRGGGGGGSVIPISVPGGYDFAFGPPHWRVQRYGHIWLDNGHDPQGYSVELHLEIDPNVSPGFVFLSNAAPLPNSGSSALWISADPAKQGFNGLGVFSNPTLDATNTELWFTSTNTGGGLYYYQINVIDQLNNNQVVAWDPIIVNQP